MTEPIKTSSSLKISRKAYLDAQEKYDYIVYVCGGAGCVAAKCDTVKTTLLAEKLKKPVSAARFPSSRPGAWAPAPSAP